MGLNSGHFSFSAHKTLSHPLSQPGENRSSELKTPSSALLTSSSRSMVLRLWRHKNLPQGLF